MIIYDMGLTDYRNIITKYKIWKDIASKIGKSSKYNDIYYIL